MKSRFIILFAVIGLSTKYLSAQMILHSPDGKTELKVSIYDNLVYSVKHNGVFVLNSSPIQMDLITGEKLGHQPELLSSNIKKNNQVITPPYGINSSISDNYEELILNFKGNYSLIFRAYDEGVAYRFVTNFKGNITVKSEFIRYQLPEYLKGWFPDTKNYETTYIYRTVEDKDKSNDLYLPFVVNGPEGTKLAFTESDLFDYPSLMLRKSNDYENHLVGSFQQYPTKFAPGGFNNYILEVKETASHIAQTSGTRTFPWRVMIIADNDAQLASNELVYKLASPKSPNSDFSWVKPGKVQWDWWADYVIEGASFKVGINTASYLYNVDFAAKNGIEYIIIDWNWTDRDDLSIVNPEVDIKLIIKTAKEKGVGVILWCPSFTLYRQLKKAFPLFASWGAAGVKVDFFDRDDQLANQMYEAIAKTAAEHKMIVDFHGCSKPTGLERKYPNILNYEAILGNENNKWGNKITPEHKVTLSFIRFLAGPADFTPGGMRNCNANEFANRGTLPNTIGTRCSEMALYVVYYEPLKMFCDAPTSYAKEPIVFNFLKKIPTVWDETKIIDAKMGDYVIIARRKGSTWYIAAINDDTPRTVSVPLNFLGNGTFRFEIFTDSPNSEHYAIDYTRSESEVTSEKPLTIKLAKGGGFIMSLQAK
ncbi:MAG: glycoside hydrolase family 97 protein [Cytophagales bacterium]|nr:MAG: glycoside hydrolase family 97 protein [Cytophagales bacterium]